MDKETYEALKRIMKCDYEREDTDLQERDVLRVEAWIDEVAEDIDPSEIICKGCGKPILDGQSIISGDNRHSACA